MKSLQAAVLGKADRDVSPHPLPPAYPPLASHIDAAVSPQQFWEMAAICSRAAICMNLIQPTYRFHHQPCWLALTLVLGSTHDSPPHTRQNPVSASPSTLSRSAAEGLSGMNGKAKRW